VSGFVPMRRFGDFPHALFVAMFLLVGIRLPGGAPSLSDAHREIAAAMTASGAAIDRYTGGLGYAMKRVWRSVNCSG
jgi:hypothetical protein